MFEVPEHQMMPVDKDGNGPVGQDEMWGYRCWCNTDCGTVEHVYNAQGGPMCEDMAREGFDPPEVSGEHRPGFCVKCHAYTVGLFKLLLDAEREDEQ